MAINMHSPFLAMIISNLEYRHLERSLFDLLCGLYLLLPVGGGGGVDRVIE